MWDPALRSIRRSTGRLGFDGNATNDKSAVARDLAVEWMVVFTLDDSVPLVDGKIVGSACCMQTAAVLDVIIRRNQPSSNPVAPVFAGGVDERRALFDARVSVGGFGAYVVGEQPVTLELEFDGNLAG